MVESATERDDLVVLTFLERDAMADVRALISVLSEVVIPLSTTVNDDVAVLKTVDNDAAALVRTLVSVLSAVPTPLSTTFNDDAAVLIMDDKLETSVKRVLISVLNALPCCTSLDAREETEVLMMVEIDAIAEFRRLISDVMDFNKMEFPFMTVDASEGSFPMAVAKSANVFMVEDKPSPARALIFTFTNSSVAITFVLYLG